MLSCLFAILIITACSSDHLQPEFRITGSNFELMSEGGDITIDVIHNVSYGVSIDGNWITQNQSKSSSTGKLTFSVAENPTNDRRKGTITFTSEEAGATEVVNVSQHGRFEIYYTNSITDAAIMPKETNVFGAEILSNTYVEGKGIIKFSGPVTQIGDDAFYDREITSIDLPNTVTRIGNKAFFGCGYLKTLEIPNSVTTIDEGAFNGCTSLERITLPDSLKVIKDRTFYDCESLKAMNLPMGLIEIGNYAFYDCFGLTEITIPGKVSGIGEYAFSGNLKLEKFTIPSGVAEIKDGTFSNCPNLKEITIPVGVKSIGESVFSNCYSLTGINIPGSVTSIGAMAFTACTGLTEIKVPAGIKTIEFYTFASCTSLIAVELPASITTISKAFDGCSSLISLKCLATNPPALVMPEMFSGPYRFDLPNLKIYVPKSSLESYKNADVWKEHADIIFPIEES